MKQEIDYEALNPKQLSVTIRAVAEDGVRFVDATLIIDIVDVNDNAPKFLQPVSSYCIYSKCLKIS